jgi:bifunctional non-homologous end joining protein LigD
MPKPARRARAARSKRETEALDRYRSMRDFEVTPEPSGAEGDEQAGADGHGRFVVQEHHARRLHWDFRLERDGVLVSWALPRGVPPDPKVNHLAVPTEDHPLSYIDFEGEIPAGNYGAGNVTIWDHGTYECEKWEDDEVMVILHGQRVTGRYVLFPTGERKWMIHRMSPPQDPDRQPLPTDLRPMEAVPGDLPAGDEDWAFEIAWDGRRVLLLGEGGRVQVQGPDGDETARWPELSRLGRALGAHQVVLDGVLVTVDDDGRPRRGGLDRRLEAVGTTTARRRAKEEPAAYMLIDLLHLDGHPTLDLPYTERVARLAALGLAGSAWQTPGHHVGDGAALLQAARTQGLAGVVAKRLDRPYRPGERSPDWVLVRA